ncbi:MAG: riboflavin synthase [Steroidobacteraceae bacterium]|nr:riboflavin synthase [Steroidobacteraceae bacterium]MDW8258488.1 riboflavin synthase [Gammaproteobacteria bacterium]
MFTGIVHGVGTLLAREPRGADQQLAFALPGLGSHRVRTGDSVAINGCCLTAVAADADRFVADVSPETLRLTNLGALAIGDRVNWEASLCVGEPLGGHFVTGHVDGLARIVAVTEVGRAAHVRLRAPPELARYLARKGSVALDGVSLTINAVDGAEFEVMLIPHTRAVTTFDTLESDRALNIEVDVLARYLERQRDAGRS